VTINGGRINIHAGVGTGVADGIDSNGSIYVYGGTVTITKPATTRDYEALDCDKEFVMYGGDIYVDGTHYTKDNYTDYRGGMGMPGGWRPQGR
jgi:hypothetical protein